MRAVERPEDLARVAVVDLFRGEREWRVFFRKCCEHSAFRLRSQAWQVRDELAERGKRFKLEEVEDVLLALAREKLPNEPAARWDAEWASRLCREALARLGERFTELTEDERKGLDLSGQELHESAMSAAGEGNDPAAFRRALAGWERAGLDAFDSARSRKPVAS